MDKVSYSGGDVKAKEDVLLGVCFEPGKAKGLKPLAMKLRDFSVGV